MESQIESYISYIVSVRRYSLRTADIYRDVLTEYEDFSGINYTASGIRAYEVHLMDDEGLSPRTVNQHLSVLSGYCSYLLRRGYLKSNPVRLVSRPKEEKRLPDFYRPASMDEYFESHCGTLEFGTYDAALRYMIVRLLFGTGIRRSELISLNVSSIDFSRGVARVMGKGDKLREVPFPNTILQEIKLFLGRLSSEPKLSSLPDSPLLQTPSGNRLYPVFVDRTIKAELGTVADITSRKSPHVLRHTIATELLDSGADLNSIKELLGHSSLAATQVYTHNTIERLQSVYQEAHPLAKK